MEVKLEKLPGLTSSTKLHSAGWTPVSARLIVQQSMLDYSIGFALVFVFRFFLMFIIRFWFWFSLYNLKAKTKTEK